MSWLCIFTLSCLANPATPVALPPTPEIMVSQAAEPIPVAAHVQPVAPSAGRSASDAAASSAPPVSCELRWVRRGRAQVVLAVVQTSAAAAGEYEFSVDARDAKRNVVSSSTGDGFRVRAGERLELEGPSVDLGHGAALVAHLELRDRDDRILTTCQL